MHFEAVHQKRRYVSVWKNEDFLSGRPSRLFGKIEERQTEEVLHYNAEHDTDVYLQKEIFENQENRVEFAEIR